MLDDEKSDEFILSMNKAIIKCCSEYNANKIEAISAIGEIFIAASVAIGIDVRAFELSLLILRDGFIQTFEGRNKSI